MKLLLFIAAGITAGIATTLQGVINTGLESRTGFAGSVFIVTWVSAFVMLLLLFIFPSHSNFQNLPGIKQWYLYIGGLFGIIIISTPVFLIPRIGVTLTITVMIVGQLLIAAVIDHFGLFNLPVIKMSFSRITGIILLLAAVILVKK